MSLRKSNTARVIAIARKKQEAVPGGTASLFFKHLVIGAMPCIVGRDKK